MEVYYDPTSSAGFSGRNNLRKSSKRTDKQIREFLHNQPTYTRHYRRRRSRKFNRIECKGIDDLWQADLADLRSLAGQNDGIRHWLVVCDTFSKFVWLQPLKTKKTAEVLLAFQQIGPRKPNALLTDGGSEFQSRVFQSYLVDSGIKYFTTIGTDNKAAGAERTIRTIKMKVGRFMIIYKT